MPRTGDGHGRRPGGGAHLTLDRRGFDPAPPAGDVAQRAFMGRFRHAMKPMNATARVPAYSLRSRGQRSETTGVGRPDMADGRGFDPALLKPSLAGCVEAEGRNASAGLGREPMRSACASHILRSCLRSMPCQHHGARPRIKSGATGGGLSKRRKDQTTKRHRSTPCQRHRARSRLYGRDDRRFFETTKRPNDQTT